IIAHSPIASSIKSRTTGPPASRNSWMSYRKRNGSIGISGPSAGNGPARLGLLGDDPRRLFLEHVHEVAAARVQVAVQQEERNRHDEPQHRRHECLRDAAR